MAGANATRSVLYALCANSAIAVAKFFAAFLTGSGAMLAEAIHSVADASNQVLLLLGIRRAKRPPSMEHPLGWGKAVYVWSFLVAVILFTVGGLYSLYEGVHKLQHPVPLTAPWIAIGVLVFAIAAESVSLWGCLREVNKVRRGRGYWRWFRESREAALVVIFGEDLAALGGLVCALVAVAASALTGDPLYDALGTLAIGVLLIVVAVLIAREVKALLIGQGADPAVVDDMRQFLRGQPQVGQVYSLLTLQLGADVLVSVKARFDVDCGELVPAINRLEAAFSKRFPEVVWLFVEPDDRD